MNLTVQGTLVEWCHAVTGSCRTIISSRIFEGLAEKPEIERWPRGNSLHGLGGGELYPAGTAICRLDLEPHVLYHPVVVTGGMNFPMILGVDVLRPHGVQITLGHQDHIHVAADRCDVCVEQDPEAPAARGRLDLNPKEIKQETLVSPVATTISDLVVAPHSCVLAEFRLSGKVPDGTELMAEPNAGTLERHMFSCLSAVVSAEEDQIVRLVLVNPSQTKRRVLAGATVATFRAVAPDQGISPVTEAPGPKLSKRQKLNNILSELN